MKEPMTEDEFRKCIDYMNNNTPFLTEIQIQMLYTLYLASHVDFDAVFEQMRREEGSGIIGE